MAELNTDYTVKLGLLAEYATPGELMRAAEKFRDAGYRRWDVYTPFPVHGMDQAMGLGNSKVGWFTFLGGLTGYTSGMIMIWWMNAFDYPLAVGGKPLISHREGVDRAEEWLTTDRERVVESIHPPNHDHTGGVAG